MNRGFKALVESLKPKLKNGTVNLENDHQYTISLGGYLLMVHLLPDEEQILLATSLGPLPRGNLGGFFLAMLQGQYLYLQTSGATLAIDHSGTFAVLQALLPLSLTDVNVLERSVEGFLHTADFWRRELEAFSQSQERAKQDERTLMFANFLPA